MNPDATSPICRDVACYVSSVKPFGNKSQALSQSSAIFVIPRHAQEPPGRREEQRQHCRQTVEPIHGEVWIILNGSGIIFILLCELRADEPKKLAADCR